MSNDVLDGKTCLLTGASGGIGNEIAIKLIENNCNIFLTGATQTKLENLVHKLESINQNNVQIKYSTCDLSNTDDLAKLIDKVRNTFSTIDVLINCAGVFPKTTLENSSLAEFENCFNVNVRAPFVLSQEFSKDMINKKWGRIVNIGSSSSYEGFKETSVYCASKHALLGFSRSLSDELKEFNVRTFCISPGSVKTDMAKILTTQDFSTFIDPQEIAQMLIFVICFDNEMISEEIRLNRITKNN